jgi:putative ATPase
MEQGTIILVGATTQNPYFTLNNALLSRSRVCELKPLDEKHLDLILDRALSDKERGLGETKVDLKPEARAFLKRASSGDARTLLNALEVGALTTPPGNDGVVSFTLEVAEESIQKRSVAYDAAGDQHYDTISAFIKSMRGSDPDATLYYLAKMIYAGEDPRFIARRIVICAAEDVGNADPLALVVANSAMQVAEFVGMPEARIPLAQAAVYVATAPKSNAAYAGINAAMQDIETEMTMPVPDHLKNKLAWVKDEKRGKGYKYSHDSKTGYIPQEYLEQRKKYYEPKDIGYEKKIKARMDEFKKQAGS